MAKRAMKTTDLSHLIAGFPQRPASGKAEQPQIVRGDAVTRPAGIFAPQHIQHPVQAVINTPVSTVQAHRLLRLEQTGTDEIAAFDTGFAVHGTVRLDPRQPPQSRPVLADTCQPRRLVGDAANPSFQPALAGRRKPLPDRLAMFYNH